MKKCTSSPIRSTVSASFCCDIQTLWHAVTDLSNTAWRSGLSRVVTSENGQFIEYTHGGFPTTFTVTQKDPPIRWAFTLENANLAGEWTGIFSSLSDGAHLTCTECVRLKRRLPRFLVRIYLKKQQQQYMRDLRRRIGV